MIQKRPEESVDEPPQIQKWGLDPLGKPLKLKKKVSGYLLYSYGLGQGTFGKTALACAEEDPLNFLACKMVDKVEIMKQKEHIQLFQDRLQAEVDTWKRMDHPNIVRFLDLRETQNSLYMFMEYCVQTLEKKLRPPTMKMVEKEAIPVFKQISDGCKYLYEQNVVHRDLKPTNILIGTDGQWKIADFGFAKFLQPAQKDKEHTQSYGIGTYQYMSPQVLNREPYSIKTDVWSLGIIFYEVLIGQTPETFLGGQMVNSETIVFPPGVVISQQMRDLIKSMLVNEEANRITIKEVLARLSDFL